MNSIIAKHLVYLPVQALRGEQVRAHLTEVKRVAN